MIHVRCTKCDAVYPANQEHRCIVIKPKAKAITTPSERTQAWRAANRERYNEYMRKRRAKEKAK